MSDAAFIITTNHAQAVDCCEQTKRKERERIIELVTRCWLSRSLDFHADKKVRILKDLVEDVDALPLQRFEDQRKGFMQACDAILAALREGEFDANNSR